MPLGQMAIKTRAKANTDPAVLAEYGNGDEWPLKLAFDKGEVHENGNYYQREELSVRHGICGDPKQVSSCAFDHVLLRAYFISDLFYHISDK